MTVPTMYVIIIIPILQAALVIVMIAGTMIASQLLVTAKAKVTMLHTKTNPDQELDHNQGPCLVILKTQDTIMVTTFIMMTLQE